MGVQSAALRVKRLQPLDALRGFIIMLMALDHANYFIAQRHPIGEHWGGPFPAYDSAVAFSTRLVTHLCAPGFFFLMGTGISLFTSSRRTRGWTWAQIRAHFLVRGLILILIQFILVNPIWKISPIPFPRWYQGVLVALGGTMILAVLFLRFKTWQLFAASALLLVGLEVTHPGPAQWGLLSDEPLGLILVFSGGNQAYWVNYPILPWLELVLLGMAFGCWFGRQPEPVYQRGFMLGILLLTAFIPLRAMNGFGNIRPMAGTSWKDFLNVVKYPPSMTFTFLTMGINLILLYWIARIEACIKGFVGLAALYGRAPLFLYVVHLLLYAMLGRWLTPDGSTFGLMYVLWLAGLVGLYPMAKLYSRLKQRRQFRLILRYL